MSKIGRVSASGRYVLEWKGKLRAHGSKLIAKKKKPTRGAVDGGPSMNPHYTVGTRRSSLGISAWRNVAHRTEYESSSLFIEHWFKKR